jgi:Flp pilus assembly protein TadD
MARTPLTPDEIRAIEALGRAAENGTHYDVLDLPAGVDSAAVDAAYRTFARTWHPDRFYTRDTGEHATTIDTVFATATRAFQVLGDAGKRAAYDRELASQGRSPGAVRRNAETVGSWRNAGARPTVQRETPLPANAAQENPFRSGSPSHRPEAARPAATIGATAEVIGIPRAQGARAPTPPAAAAPTGPTPAAATPPPRVPPVLDRVRAQLAEQMTKARAYYETGKQDLEAGNFSKAEGNLYLATTFDPRNAGYARLLAIAKQRAGEGRARAYVAQAESEESYARPKEALALYRKAVDCDPPEGVAFFRTGKLLISQENDERGAVAMFRKAVQKEPSNAAYRMALAEVYERNGLSANALREATAALASDGGNEAAKSMVKRLKR